MPFAEAFAHAELFFGEMVELQDERIALSAVHAWVLAEAHRRQVTSARQAADGNRTRVISLEG